MTRKERSDKELRKQNSIKYPRKCETCDYISNNPSMFQYHKKTHASVEEKFCRCGAIATHVCTRGKYRCNENPHLCPKFLEEHAERIEGHWARDSAVERKEKARTTFVEHLHNEEIYKKTSRTKRIKTGILTEERRRVFRRYAYACRKISQQWAKDNGYEIGRQTFHVDHIYSVLDGFKNEVPPSIISHPKNLRILEAKKNSSKGPKSELSLEELYLLVKD